MGALKHGIKAEVKRREHICRPNTNGFAVRMANSYVNAFNMGNGKETSLQPVEHSARNGDSK